MKKYQNRNSTPPDGIVKLKPGMKHKFDHKLSNSIHEKVHKAAAKGNIINQIFSSFNGTPLDIKEESE